MVPGWGRRMGKPLTGDDNIRILKGLRFQNEMVCLECAKAGPGSASHARGDAGL